MGCTSPEPCGLYPDLLETWSRGLGKCIEVQISLTRKGTRWGGWGPGTGRGEKPLPLPASPQLSDKQNRQELRYSPLLLPPNKDV